MNRLLFKIRPTILSIFIVLSTAIIAILLTVQYFTGLESANKKTQEDAANIAQTIYEKLLSDDLLNGNFIDFVQHIPQIKAYESLANSEQFLQVAITHMQKRQNVYATYVGFKEGMFYEVINLSLDASMYKAFNAPTNAKWLVIQILNQDGFAMRKEVFLNQNLEEIFMRQIPTTYNPSYRPWFVLAYENGGINKTKPYEYAHINASGITYSKKVPDYDAVIGVDLTFFAIEASIKSYPVLERTQIYLLDEQNTVLATNGEKHTFSFNIQNNSQGFFDNEGNRYFGDYIPLKDGSELSLFVAVPYDVVMAPYMHSLYKSLIIAAVIVSAVIPFIVYLTKIIVMPIRLIEQENQKVQNGQYDKVRYVKTYVFELDQLAKSLVETASIIKKHEEYLQKTSLNLLQQYKDTIDRSAIVSKTDKDGNITYVNDYFCEVSGYAKEELIGRSHNIIRHSDMPDRLFENLWNTVKEQKKPWRGEIKNRKKDGSFYWVQSFVNPILDENGEVIEFIAIRHNITRQKAMFDYFENRLSITTQNFEHALHLSKEYEKAIDKSNVLSRADLNGVITYVNDEFVNLSGYSKDELVGKTHAIVSSPNMPKKFYKTIWDTIEKGEVWQGVIKNLSKYNKPFWTATSIVPIHDEGNKIIEYMAIRHDLTELFELHREIEATQKEIVYKMGEIGESRSKETGNHVRRVAEYSKLLAVLWGLSYREAEILFTASPMHDIGKVGIPDSVLKKPGKLDEDEWEVMKTHR
jgi:PAS domain S-box-containing protein